MGMLDIVVEKLPHYPKDKELPKHAHEGDAAIDLLAAISEQIVLRPGEWAKIPTGLKIQVPQGTVCLIFPRSGSGCKGIGLKNLVGVIDSSYTGEIMLTPWNTNVYLNLPASYTDRIVIKPGDRIAQAVFVPFIAVNPVEGKLEATNRGEGGFGSTGD